jgi:hypothetical protein
MWTLTATQLLAAFLQAAADIGLGGVRNHDFSSFAERSSVVVHG